MIPLLLVTNNSRELKKFLASLRSKEDIFIEITPEKTGYSINEIKNIISETKIYYKQKRIYYLPNFESSSLPAQNAFLKILEEPPTNVQIVLTTNKISKLLPTVVSRCIITNLLSLVMKDDVEIQSLLLSFVLNQKKEIFNRKPFNKVDKESFNKLVDQMLLFFQKRLRADNKAGRIIKEIIKLKSLVENNNLNPQLTVDHILIYVMKRYTMK